MTKKTKNKIWTTLFVVFSLMFGFALSYVLDKAATNPNNKKVDTVKVEVILKATEAPEGTSFFPAGYEPHEQKLCVRWVNGEPYSLLDSLKTQVVEVRDSTLANSQKCSASTR